MGSFSQLPTKALAECSRMTFCTNMILFFIHYRGFCITYGDGYRSHIFKPVSVQTMWSALQSLYRASECAKKNNSYQVTAVRYYDGLFQANKSDVACLNEWNVLPGVEPKRPLISNM